MPLTKSPIIVAHRGFHLTHPENSRAAFQAAWAAGIKWCECDVQITADGVPVVIHDDTLDRTTTASGRVSEVTWEILQRDCRLRTACGSLSDHRLHSLFDVLKAMAMSPKPASLLIELKPPNHEGGVRSILEILKKLGDREQCMLQSFDKANVLFAHQADRTQSLALLVEDAETLASMLESPWPRIHVRHDLLDEATMLAFFRQGTAVGVWTVNEESDIRRVIELGVDMIITDEPLLAQRIVRDIAGEIV